MNIHKDKMLWYNTGYCIIQGIVLRLLRKIKRIYRRNIER